MTELLEQLCIYTNQNKPDRIFPEEQFHAREMNRTDRFKVQDTWGWAALNFYFFLSFIISEYQLTD
jgi:hypothetical protein